MCVTVARLPPTPWPAGPSRAGFLRHRPHASLHVHMHLHLLLSGRDNPFLTGVKDSEPEDMHPHGIGSITFTVK
jgi:hypothetical protein